MKAAVQAGDDGFTLVELLVAMSLLTVLMALVFGGLSFGTRAWEKTSRRATGADDVRFAQALIRDDISASYPMLQSSGSPSIAFDGGASALSLLTRGPRGHAKVNLAVSSRPHGITLTRAMRDELALDAAAGPAPRILIDGAQSVTFSYFGAPSPGRPRQWNDSWSGATRPPELVRVEVVFPPGDSRRWPALIVAPRIAADVACRYDPASKYCVGR